MASSTVAICNIALGKLGGTSIMTLDDGTTESDLCLENHEVARDKALAAVDWTFARKRARLVPLSGESGTIEGSDFSARFRLPTDCLSLRHVSADGSFEDEVTWEKEGATILASKDVLYIKYTCRCTDVNIFSPGFVDLYAVSLAADICVALTGSTKREGILQAAALNLTDMAGGADGVQSLPEKQKATRITKARFRYA